MAPVILHSLPNSELFVAIDDDHFQPGYSFDFRRLILIDADDSIKLKEYGYHQKKAKIKKIYFPKNYNHYF